MILYYFFIFILGLVIGSFLNAVIYRLDKKNSILKGRSRCPKCRKVISWHDNIPILSFVLLKGRCRRCHKEISWQYPLVEFFTGLVFLINSYILASRINFTSFSLDFFYNLIISFIISAFLIIIFVYDFRYYLISDKVVWSLAGVAFLYNIFNYSLINLLIGAIIGVGFFLVQYLVSKGKWIGQGDIILGLAMGLILAWPKILIGIFLSYLIGSIIAIVLVVINQKKFQSRIPFGPFLATGTYLAWLFGDYLIKRFIYF